ncbi:hypothetical protein ACS0TY_020828 [Phlomoides rotata]
MILKAELGSAQIKDSSVTVFMHSLKSKADELASIDEHMSNDDFTICVINDLGPKYHDIIISIRAQPNSISFSNLIDMIVAQ